MTTERERELFRKAVRARSLTDPLGAMGFRVTGERVQRETRVRKWAFAGAVGTFATIFALIAGTSSQTPETNAQSARFDSSAFQPQTSEQRNQTQIEIIQPSHTQTRGS